MPYVDDLVIVNCADDAERLARLHVRKSPFYQLLFLGKNGVLSTPGVCRARACVCGRACVCACVCECVCGCSCVCELV
jgi:hypothetical protein